MNIEVYDRIMRLSSMVIVASSIVYDVYQRLSASEREWLKSTLNNIQGECLPIDEISNHLDRTAEALSDMACDFLDE